MEQLNSINYIDGKWIEGNPKIIGPLSHGSWMGSPVFDGGRCFNGYAPDLQKHCDRILSSAHAMLMKPPIESSEIFDIAITGIKRLGSSKDLYIRPLMWAESSMGLLRCDPNSTRFCLSIINMPMPKEDGFSACTTNYTRPTTLSAPTDAKAACLYPNGARAMQEASNKGYDNAIILDPEGFVAEFASSNIFIVINNEILTPEANGTFLAGITRQTVINICQSLNLRVTEKKISIDSLNRASEIFSTGNFGKVMYLNRLNKRKLNPGPFYTKIKKAYWEYSSDFSL